MWEMKQKDEGQEARRDTENATGEREREEDRR